MSAKRRTIRIFPDWGHDWPLWENFTDKYAMEPTDYGLSDDLTELMARWYAFWENHCDPHDGWDSRESRTLSRIEGDRMVRMLIAEVNSFADVRDERA
ncbi:hypothetical protein GCM10027344_13780 [Spelaeicoccus albus]